MEIENNDDEVDLDKISNEVLLTHSSQKTLINSIHSLIIQFQAHLDTIIKKYKIMSVTLVAATIAAVGFAFSGELENVHINKLMMASVVCIFGIIGLTAIWYLDIQVFHKFWGAFFVEEVKMEDKHPFLVDLGAINISLDNIKARLIGDGNWYIFLNIILLTISATVFSFIYESIPTKIGIFIISALFAFLLARFMLRTSNNLLKVVEQLLCLQKSN